MQALLASTGMLFFDFHDSELRNEAGDLIERAFTDPLNRNKVELQEFHARKRVRRHLEMLRKGYLRPDPTDNQSFKDFDLLPEGHKFRKVES